MNAGATNKKRDATSAELDRCWQPEDGVVHRLLLQAILKDNPIPAAYRINYIANFYVGPLIADMEKRFGLTRPEWIVLFCLTRQPRLNAQQISIVTGRAKTSISGAVKQLQKKKLITRMTDIADNRRRVLHLTDSGRALYKSILQGFIKREADMLAALNAGERRLLVRLFDKLIANSGHWARPY